MKKERTKAERKKFIALFLVFSLLAISCTTITPTGRARGFKYPKRKQGAELKIWKKNVGYIRGELIAVKRNSLLLLESGSASNVSVDIGDVKAITIVEKSLALIGAGSGLLLSGGAVALITLENSVSFQDSLAVTILGGFVGICTLIGGVGGALAGIDKTIQIEGKSDSEIKEALEYLRKKARVTNFQ